MRGWWRLPHFLVGALLPLLPIAAFRALVEGSTIEWLLAVLLLMFVIVIPCGVLASSVLAIFDRTRAFALGLVLGLVLWTAVLFGLLRWLNNGPIWTD